MNRRILATTVITLVAAGCCGWWWWQSGQSGASMATQPQAAMRPASVRTAKLAKEKISIVVESVGTVRANEAVDITSQTSALLTRILFNEGTFVRQGAVLAELDSTQARAALAEAEAALANSRSQYTRSAEPGVSAAISKAQLQQLESVLKADEARVAAASARLADTVIKAPFSGTVGLRRVSLGAFVSPGTVITTLDDLSEVKVDFAVPETALPALRKGLLVTAMTAVYPGRTFAGQVDSVDPRIEVETRAIQVRARFANAKAALTPGMFVTVTLVREERSAIVAPEAALIPEQGKQYVYVISDNRAARREVQIGHRTPGRAEIIDGVAVGEKVVVDGALKLREGTAVIEAAERSAAD